MKVNWKQFIQGCLFTFVGLVMFTYLFGGHFIESLPVRDFGGTRRSSFFAGSVITSITLLYGMYLILFVFIRVAKDE